MTYENRYGRIVNLVRHGHSTAQAGGSADKGLSETGLRQTRNLGDILSGFALGRIVTSAMPRAVETGEILAGGLGIPSIEKDPDLNECIPPLPPDHPMFSRVSREMMEKSLEALERAYGRYFSPEPERGHVLLVTHGNVIRYLVARSFVKAPTEWIRFDLIQNASISRVAFDKAGQIRLVTYNDTRGLPGDLLTV
ncbi:MAG: histidine phosphatase family protein [candidate division NC10 bacterium]|nr:histidine phosphatase family protein [candidate division NC10 bacterium]